MRVRHVQVSLRRRTCMEWALAIVAVALLGVAAVSTRLAGTPITPAMVFVAVGVVVGPKVLDGVDICRARAATVRTLAEATLAFVLFSDASRIDLRQLRARRRPAAASARRSGCR